MTPAPHPLRVVMVAPFALEPKSTTRLRTLPLARGLAARGHQVTVLVPPYDHPEEGGRLLHSGGVVVECLPVEAVPEQSWRQAIVQPRLARAIAERARTLRPDVIHLFKPKAVSGLAHLLLWLRRLSGGSAPLVLDTDDWEGDGGWNEYEQYPWWQKRVCDWQERWGLEHAAALTVASRTLEAQAWSHRVPPERVRYLPNGLDPADYLGWLEVEPATLTSSARGPANGGPVALLYTRFFEFAPERAMAAFAALRARVPDARLLVVGAGKYGQERVLASLAQQQGWGDDVTLAGWQAPHQIPALIRACEVALFPADDNLANRAKCSVKVLECMWLGLPVAADGVGQYAEYVRDGQTGLLGEPKHPETLGVAAARLLQDESLATKLAVRATRRLKEELSWEHLAGAAEEAYAVALGRQVGADRWGPAREPVARVPASR